MARSGSGRVRQRLTGLAAVLVMVAVVVGVPVLLVAISGSPVPSSVPSLAQVWARLTSRDDGTLLLGLIRVVAWVAWLVFAVSLLAEVLARVRGLPAPQLPGLRVPQSAARGLVAAAVVLFVATPVLGSAGPARAAALATGAAHPTVATAPVHAGRATPTVAGGWTAGHAAAGQKPAAVTTRTQVPTVEHLVRRGESLWSIARAYLGSGERYQEIEALNRDVLGHRPSFLQAGWVLRVPASAVSPTAHRAPAPAPTPTPDGSHEYTVEAGDTLSEIAHEQLGDASRYPQIAQASTATVQPGGVHLSDPDVIDVGWRLTIPANTDQAAAPETTAASSSPSAPSPTVAQPGQAPEGAPAGASGSAPGVDGGQVTGSETEAAAPVVTPGRDAPRPPTVLPSPGKPAALEQQQPDSAAGPVAPTSTPTTSPSPSAPTRTAAPTADAQAAAGSAEQQPGSDGWVLAGLTGAGAVLAGSLLLLLRGLRARQVRARRPGRTIRPPAPALLPVEKTLVAVGSGTGSWVAALDGMLRWLARLQAAEGRPMPQLVAVSMSRAGVSLHLAGPARLPWPWVDLGDQLGWSAVPDEHLAELESDPVREQMAPYPLLVTVGASDRGDVWLLNLEQLSTVTVTGDPTFGADFLRSVATEIVCHPWAQWALLTCVGVGQDAGGVNPERVAVHPPGAGPVQTVLAEAARTVDQADEEDADTATGRAAQLGAEAWWAQLLIVDAAADPRTGDGVEQLLKLLHERPGRTGTAVMLAALGEGASVEGVEVVLTGQGRVRVPSVGLDLVAAGLTPDEVAGCAALMAQSRDLISVEVPAAPAAADGDNGTGQQWRTLVDRAGAVLAEHTLPRDTPLAERTEPAASVLDGPDEEYLQVAATTRRDLAALAPLIPDRTRATLVSSDPTLDGDLAAWFDPDSQVARLRLLGPITVTAFGAPPTSRLAYFTELLVFLALASRGRTRLAVQEAFGIQEVTVRSHCNVVRHWLGQDPRTGELYLPNAKSVGAQRGSDPVYVVSGLLVDADLCCRLRKRAAGRGADGMADLTTALSLVTGEPFQGARGGVYPWLVAEERQDEYLRVMVSDIAHTVATQALRDTDAATARAAVEVAAKAAPQAEIWRTDQAAVAEQEGDMVQAKRMLLDGVLNRSDDAGAPQDPTERSTEVFAVRGWSARDLAG